MPLLVENPDHFARRPTALGFTQLVGSHIQLDRLHVDSQRFDLTEDSKVKLNLMPVQWQALGFKGHLAPSFSLRVYLWVSLYENGQPLGSKIIGETCTAPIVWDLQRSDTAIWFATQGDERPMIRLESGTYWMNFFYYGRTPSTILNRTIQTIQESSSS